jgi:methylated-DNA-protein-cysteine methyltransferase related protein
MSTDTENTDEKANDFTAIYDYVRTIPPGQVLSYGDVGQAVGATARTVGWAMGAIVEDDSAEPVPWHRVVGADGYLRIARRSAELAKEQRTRLESEGVTFDNKNCVRAEFFGEILPPEPQQKLEID